jgi:hypothetical protein
VHALESAAGKLEDEFDLLACVREKAGGGSRSTFEAQLLSALTFGSRSQIFVRSTQISPDLPIADLSERGSWPRVFTVSGLVVLHHPFPSKTRPGESSIGIVHRVRHNVRGEIREHAAYDRLFKTL